MSFTDRIRAADPDFDRGETAWLLACEALGPADWHLLAGALDVDGACWRWDTARAARAALADIRPWQQFSANRLRQILPRRAHPLVPGTVKAMTLEGLITATSQTERSTIPGARGWRVCLHDLTAAGKSLAAEFAPPSPYQDTYMLQLMEEAV